LRDLTFGVAVRKEGKGHFALFLEGFMAPGTVDRDPQDLRATGSEQPTGSTEHRELVTAHRTPIGRVKDENDRSVEF
jgi:hypothetical protein